jgi:hypothetical protein
MVWRQLADENTAARACNQLAAGHAHPFEQRPSWRLLRGRSIWF